MWRWALVGLAFVVMVHGGARVMWSRGIRNNNPGNIERTGTVWRGEIRGAEAEARDARFAVFEHPGYGLRALAMVLRAYDERHGLRTVEGIINRWAPSVENDSSAYVRHVADALGVEPGEAFDVRARAPRLMDAIIRHENGSQPYSAELLAAAIEAADPGGTWA